MRKQLALLCGILGVVFIVYSLTDYTITGAVIGVNPASKFLGVFGIFLMFVAVVLERYELKKHHKHF